MATKKQKREAGEARQRQNEEESKRTGLLAQAQDRAARARRAEQARKEAEKINQRHNAILAMHGLGAKALERTPS